MKILMLTPYLPYPPSSGGQVRSYNLLKQLSKKHEISLFCYIRSEEEKKFIPQLEKYCKKIKVFKRRPAWNPLNVVLAGLTPLPFLVCIYLSLTFRKAINDELKHNKYDLIHSETFYVMTNIPKTGLPIILVEQTIEYLVYQHFVNSIKFFPLRWLLKIDVTKLKFWERYFWERADKVVAVSISDKKEMLNLSPNLDVDFVPNGVDLEFFKPQPKTASKGRKILLFVSNFKWLQNIEAAEILIKEIFPLVKNKVPGASLLIVGQHTPDKIKNMARQDIKIQTVREEDVESIRSAYKSATIFVSPMKGPGGTRLKNLAAMASMLPVVTTSIGAQGIGVKDGVEVYIRNGVRDMAEGAVELLLSPQKSQKLADNARRLAEREYGWNKMAEKLDVIYSEAYQR